MNISRDRIEVCYGAPFITTTRVLVSFSLTKLIDTHLRCCLSQENLSRCMHICKFQELFGPNYQAIFQSWMDAASTKSGQCKVVSRLEHN